MRILRAVLIFVLPVVSIVLLATSCGEEDDDKATTPTTSITYSQVSDFIGNHCATSGCHDAATAQDGVDLSSHTGVKAAAAASVTAINNSSMPPSTSTDIVTSFNETAANKTNLLEYLNAGAP